MENSEELISRGIADSADIMNIASYFIHRTKINASLINLIYTFLMKLDVHKTSLKTDADCR